MCTYIGVIVEQEAVFLFRNQNVEMAGELLEHIGQQHPDKVHRHIHTYMHTYMHTYIHTYKDSQASTRWVRPKRVSMVTKLTDGCRVNGARLSNTVTVPSDT